MKRIFLFLIVAATGLLPIKAADLQTEAPVSSKLFTTSPSFDLIASLQNFDENLASTPRFSALAADSLFRHRLAKINDSVRASKLCNFYARFKADKNDTDSCVAFFRKIAINPAITASSEQWITDIAALAPELSYCLGAINDAGYGEYWQQEVSPRLTGYIDSYPVDTELLDRIHSAMTDFSGTDSLSDTHSNTYVLDTDNAFNLSDESFCCTPLLLNPELEKQFRLDFLKVYIHENLHRLPISAELMQRMDALKETDPFYNENESIARSHNEGGNEALVVAGEVFISHQIGRRDDSSVLQEFQEYVDGSLVLAPIIYVHLSDKRNGETLNDFVMRLFDNGTIKAGHVKEQYDRAMSILAKKI